MPKPFKLSERSQRLIHYLRSFDKNTEVTYRQLTDLIGEPITAAKTSHVRLALQRDVNQIWICIRPNVGLRRLNDREIAERLPSWWLGGARRKLARGGRQAGVVDLQQLNLDQQARFSVDCIQRTLAFDALSKASRQKMEHVARGSSNDLPAFTAIEWAISLTPRATVVRKDKADT